MNIKKISVIIRTYNEEKYLERLIKSIFNQKISFKSEIIIVDSGSTDKTLIIAQKYKVKIINIKKKLFTFGRSLNLGCKNAKGEVFIKIPTNEFSNEFQFIINGFSNEGLLFNTTYKTTKISF